MVGCSSDGFLLVWNLLDRPVAHSSASFIENNIHKRRKITSIFNNQKPAFEWKVGYGALYDLQFIPSSNGTQELLMTCGEDGIFVYKNFITDVQHFEKETKPELVSHYLAHPQRGRSDLFHSDMKSINYDASLGHAFVASGDGIAYIWDVNTSRIVGHLIPKMNSTADFSRNGMNAIKVVGTQSEMPCSHCVLTGGGGENALSFWSGKDHKLIQTISYSDPKATKQRNDNKKCKSWVSCIDVDGTGRWSAVGGGIREYPSKSSCTNRGYLQMVNLQSRMITSCEETKEVIHNVCYHDEYKLLSVGNCKIMSIWDPLDLNGGRTGHVWLSSPASYCVKTYSESGMVAVGNVSSSVDFLSRHLTRTSVVQR